MLSSQIAKFNLLRLHKKVNTNDWFSLTKESESESESESQS